MASRQLRNDVAAAGRNAELRQHSEQQQSCRAAFSSNVLALQLRPIAERERPPSAVALHVLRHRGEVAAAYIGLHVDAARAVDRA